MVDITAPEIQSLVEKGLIAPDTLKSPEKTIELDLLSDVLFYGTIDDLNTVLPLLTFEYIKDESGMTPFHSCINTSAPNSLEKLKILEKDPRLNKYLYEPNLYGHSILDFAIFYRRDDIIQWIKKDTTLDISTLPGYGKGLSCIDQNHLNKQLTLYISQSGGIPLDSHGYCNGWAALFLIYGPELFYQITDTISAWDGEKSTLENSSPVPGYSCLNDLFEQVSNDLIWFFHGDDRIDELKMNLTQSDYVTLLSRVKPDDWQATPVFTAERLTLTPDQLLEWLQFFSMQRDLKIVLSGMNHTTALMVDQRSLLHYYDPNFHLATPPYTDIAQLTRDIILWKYKKINRLNRNGTIDIEFYGFKINQCKEPKKELAIQPVTPTFEPKDSPNGWNALHVAVLSGHAKQLLYLIADPDNIALIRQKDAQGETPLTRAISCGQIEVMMPMIEKVHAVLSQEERMAIIQASIDCEQNDFLFTLLEKHFISFSEVLDFLAADPLDNPQRNSDALYCVTESRKKTTERIIDLLYQHTEKEALPIDLEKALFLSVKANNLDMFNWLLARKKTYQFKGFGHYMNTIFYLIVQHDQLDFVSSLIAYGHRQAVDKYGKTLLMRAQSKNNTEMIALLTETSRPTPK